MFKTSKLEVPSKLLEDINIWVTNIYSNQILTELNYYSYRLSERNKEIKVSNSLLQSEEYNLLKLILNNINVSSKLLNILQRKDINIMIPFYETEKSDIFSMTGIIDLEDYQNEKLYLNISSQYGDISNLKIDIEYRTKDKKFGNSWYTNISGIIKIITHYKNDLINIINEFEKFMSEYKRPESHLTRKINIMKVNTLKYFKYKIPIKDMYAKTFFFQSKELSQYFKNDSKIFVPVFYFSNKEGAQKVYSQESWQGLWVNQSIALFKDRNNIKNIIEEFKINKIEENIEELKKTVRHELQHMIQSYIQVMNKTNVSGGIPSKKIREKGVDPHGRDLGAPTQDLKSHHALRDIEFFTNLQDCIDSFKQIKNRFPKSMLRGLFRVFINKLDIVWFFRALDIYRKNNQPSKTFFAPLEIEYRTEAEKILQSQSLFRILENNIPKYNRAVKEFYKQVSYLL